MVRTNVSHSCVDPACGLYKGYCRGVLTCNWRNNATQSPRKQLYKKIRLMTRKIAPKTEISPKISKSRTNILRLDTHRRYHLRVLSARCDQSQTCNHWQPRISRNPPHIKNWNQEPAVSARHSQLARVHTDFSDKSFFSNIKLDSACSEQKKWEKKKKGAGLINFFEKKS